MTSKYLLELEEKVKQQEEIIGTFKKDQQASIKVFHQQEKTIENLNQSNQDLIAGHDRLDKTNSQLRNEAKKTAKQVKELQAKVKDQEQAIEGYVNQDSQAQQSKLLLKELASAKQKVKDLVKQNSSLIEKYSSLENQSQNQVKTIAKQKQELTSEQEKISLLEEKLLEAENKDLSPYVNTEESTLNHDYQKRVEELEEEKEEIISQAEMARNEQAQEIEKLETENNQLDKDLNQAVDLLEEKDKTIAELKKTIAELKTQAKTTAEINPEPVKTFLCSDCQQSKPQEELSRQFGQLSFCLECSKRARQVAQKEKQSEPQPIQFTCHLCEQSKSEVPAKMKLDKTLEEYLVCGQCRPTAKEFNEADLLTDELWSKYPYSSASEILELEFGIVKK